MERAAERLGWSFARINRNWDPARHDPAMAGYMGFGDLSGAKQSTDRTYLLDAVEHGARSSSGAFAERVLVENGRAAGRGGAVERPRRQRSDCERNGARAAGGGGRAAHSSRPRCCCARGIGGPATGEHLYPAPLLGHARRLRAGHPGLVGSAPERADQRVRGHRSDGYGFLIEGVQYTTGLGASALPWTGGAQHKAALADLRDGAVFVGLIRDHGHGARDDRRARQRRAVVLS